VEIKSPPHWAWHTKIGFKWWYLHPEIQAGIVGEGEINAYTAEILKHTQIMVLNRGMNTRLVIPNGQAVYPQDNIPPMEIVGVELAYSFRYKTVMDETDAILKNIAIQIPEAAGSDHFDEVSSGDGAPGAPGSKT
jgi:hypothetical protein